MSSDTVRSILVLLFLALLAVGFVLTTIHLVERVTEEPAPAPELEPEPAHCDATLKGTDAELDYCLVRLDRLSDGLGRCGGELDEMAEELRVVERRLARSRQAMSTVDSLNSDLGDELGVCLDQLAEVEECVAKIEGLGR